MSTHDTALIVVDVQEKLMPLIVDRAAVIWNIRRLLDAARILGVRVFASEQYPKGLGPTVPELARLLPTRHEKLSFSCLGCRPLVDELEAASLTKVLLVGIETHVCVQQTAYDLSSAGYMVYLAVDAVSSRYAIDRETAIRRLDSSGVTITTTESAMMEWCRASGTAEFKQISQLLKESGPLG
jgi:nicotinamidase-related amidase